MKLRARLLSKPSILNAKTQRLCARKYACTRRQLPGSSTAAERLLIRAGHEENLKATSNLDVGEAVVNPTFRSTPWQAERAEDDNRSVIRVAFVSESNICRSPLAAAFMQQLLKDNGLEAEAYVASRATRDYTLGERPHPSAAAAARGLGVQLDSSFQATRFDYAADTVQFDLILVMDKFTAADVMREISVYDTINKKGKYSQKVRRLGEFHPRLRELAGSDGQDIDDPLYGNDGGSLETEAVERVAVIIKEACEGLAGFLRQLKESNREAPLLESLRREMGSMQEIDWLAPPMLSKR